MLLVHFFVNKFIWESGAFYHPAGANLLFAPAISRLDLSTMLQVSYLFIRWPLQILAYFNPSLTKYTNIKRKHIFALKNKDHHIFLIPGPKLLLEV